MRDIFCTSSQFFQVVVFDDGEWRRPIPGRTARRNGTPRKGYYERVVTYETLCRKTTMRQIIERPELLQQWNDGDPNLMDLDFYMWSMELKTDAPWSTSDACISIEPPRTWRIRPVENIFSALMKYMQRVFTTPGTYRVTLPGVEWDVKKATAYTKEIVDEHGITQVRNMERHDQRWRKLPCTAWKEIVDASGKGTDWSWKQLRHVPMQPRESTKQPRRRYTIQSGNATLVFDGRTHVEWEGCFPYKNIIMFVDVINTSTR